jgi:hypothetical protein
MKKHLLFCLSFIVSGLLWSAPSIENVDFKFNGQQLIITYDITNSTPDDKFDVSIAILNEMGTKIDAKTFVGDVGNNVSGGKGKTVTWHVRTDNPSISSNIYVQVTAIERIHLKAGPHLIKSAVYPGLGNYRLDNNKYHFLYGVAAYGTLGAGIALGNSAYNNYQSYLGANSIDASNTYFDKAKSQQTQALVLVGTSAAIWTYSMVNTYLKVQKLKKVDKITPDISSYYAEKANMAITGKSPAKFLEIKENFNPPNLALDIDYDVKFFNDSGQEVFYLDADRKGTMNFKVMNTGKGDALGVKVAISEKNGVTGLSYPKEMLIGKIGKGQTKDIIIPFETQIGLSGGMASLSIEVLEQNDFGPLPFPKQVITRKFMEPKIQVMDFTFSTEKGGVPLKNEKIFLQAIVQNIGFGDARKVKIDFLVSDPNLVMNLSENTDFDLPVLGSGKGVTLNQIFLVKPKYTDTIVRVTIKITESYGKYASSKEVPISLKQELQKNLSVYGEIAVQAEIKPMSLSSDVDVNIPINPEVNPNRYALVIGNEDYKSRQPNLQIESNVEFAMNDARVFKDYLNKSLGFRQDNIIFLTNATSSEMKAELFRLSAIFSRLPNPEKAEIVFYYAGHGFPDQETQVPYLMPVDVSANNLSSAIRVNELYEQLAKTNAAKITLFIDACFTGGGRTEGLIAARSARIKPQSTPISGNMVVFNASSGTQTALPFKDQKHGYFTYYLLKKIQETKGDISYADLDKYLRETVPLETTKALRSQDPEVNASPALKDNWKKWKLK